MERRAGHETVIPVQKHSLPKLPYWEQFVVTEKTTKDMKVTIDRWNLMQQCLIDNDLMEQK